MHLEGGAGIPDTWSRLWAPHRMDYLKGENRPLEGNTVACPFCTIPALSDEEGLIVHRGETAYVVMNLYPYNAGHLLVCTYRHIADLTDLTENERNEKKIYLKNCINSTRQAIINGEIKTEVELRKFINEILF